MVYIRDVSGEGVFDTASSTTFFDTQYSNRLHSHNVKMLSLTHFIIAAATLALPITAQSNCTTNMPQSFNATGKILGHSFLGNITRYITSQATFSDISDRLAINL